MDKRATIQGLVAVALLAAAAFLGWRFWPSNGDRSDGMIYFYDLSEQKLFSAPRASVPPIRGINDAEPDGVRAIVISTSGNPRDKQHRTIAYLEMYTPEMKAQFEAVRRAEAAGQSTVGLIPHGVVPRNTLVRRLNESAWHPMTSTEGEKIVSEWNVPGPGGKYPVVCQP